MKKSLMIAGPAAVLAAALISWLFVGSFPQDRPEDLRAKILTNKTVVANRALGNARVKLAGKVVGDPEYDQFGTHFQLYLVAGGKTADVVVDYPANRELADGAAVRVLGRISGSFKGRLDNGEQVTMARIAATKLEPIRPEEAIAPATAAWEQRTGAKINGMGIAVAKVEFARLETRFYIEATNTNAYPVVFHFYNSIAAQKGRRLGPKLEQPQDYKQFPVDIAAGAADTGIITFPRLSVKDGPINLTVHLSGGDWEKEHVFQLRPPE